MKLGINVVCCYNLYDYKHKDMTKPLTKHATKTQWQLGKLYNVNPTKQMQTKSNVTKLRDKPTRY